LVWNVLCLILFLFHVDVTVGCHNVNVFCM